MDVDAITGESMRYPQQADASVGRGRLHPALPVEGDGRSPYIVYWERRNV
jgi:hypothetical protein